MLKNNSKKFMTNPKTNLIALPVCFSWGSSVTMQLEISMFLGFPVPGFHFAAI